MMTVMITPEKNQDDKDNNEYIICILYVCMDVPVYVYVWIWLGAIDNMDEGDDDECVHNPSCVPK